MRKLVYFLFLIIASIGCTPKVLFDTNPEHLKPVPDIFKLGAHSTVRNSESVLTIYDESKATFQTKGVITILDEKHRDEGEFLLFYDRFRKVDFLNVQVRNSLGMIVGRYTIKDADDYSASGGNFYTDARVKVLSAYSNSYPYTIEYEYKYSYNGTLNLPNWYPVSYSQSLQQASFEIIDYTFGNIRHYTRNLDEKPVVTEHSNFISTRWDLNWQLAKESEVYSPPYSELFPNVVTSASKFEIEKSKGDASNWRSFGKWYFDLSKGKRELPVKARAEVDALLKGVDDQQDKVFKLYHYMQDITRYVSIQLGLGGWEPFSAEFVYQNKYGDCKALVNFMHALLEYAGIKAEPALIRNGLGSPTVISDFPSNQFNHVILRVTLDSGKIIWLECTSKYIKPGNVGAGNEGKNVLVVNAEGGEMIKTAISSYSDNTVTRLLTVKLHESGSAQLSSTVKKTGIMEADYLHRLKPISEKKREEWLHKSIPLNNFKLQNYKIKGLENHNENAELEFNIIANDFASSSSKRLFVPVNSLNRWDVFIPDEEHRQTNIKLPYEFMEEDSTIFEIPTGYILESSPGNITIENDFGMFSANLTSSGDAITYKRELHVFAREFPKENYSDFREFFSEINKADRSRFVLVKAPD